MRKCSRMASSMWNNIIKQCYKTQILRKQSDMQIMVPQRQTQNDEINIKDMACVNLHTGI